MASHLRLAVSLVTFAAVLVLSSAAPASAEGCVRAGLQGVNAECQWTYAEYSASAGSGDGHTWYVTVQPANGGIQRDDLICTEGAETGLWHDVFMDGADVGDVCVPDSAVDDAAIGEMVIRRFKNIRWPD